MRTIRKDADKIDRKVIAVDFDGTLVFNQYPFIENPNIALIDFIKQHRKEYIWILWTCREGVQLQYAIDYLKDEFDLEFDHVNENCPKMLALFPNSRKIGCDYYIDDKLLDWRDLIGK